MAKIGLNNFWYSKATVAGSTITYGTPATPGKAVDFTFTPTLADASLYADDGLAEYDNQVTGGDVSLGVAEADDTTMNALLGHTFGTSPDTAVQTSDINDTIPYNGVGRITRLMVNGTQKFRATVLRLVKFAEPSEEENTRGETVSFATYTLPGKMIIPADGKWRRRETFDTYDAAVTWVKTELGYVAPTP